MGGVPYHENLMFNWPFTLPPLTNHETPSPFALYLKRHFLCVTAYMRPFLHIIISDLDRIYMASKTAVDKHWSICCHPLPFDCYKMQTESWHLSFHELPESGCSSRTWCVVEWYAWIYFELFSFKTLPAFAWIGGWSGPLRAALLTLELSFRGKHTNTSPQWLPVRGWKLSNHNWNCALQDRPIWALIVRKVKCWDKKRKGKYPRIPNLLIINPKWASKWTV